MVKQAAPMERTNCCCWTLYYRWLFSSRRLKEVPWCVYWWRWRVHRSHWNHFEHGAKNSLGWSWTTGGEKLDPIAPRRLIKQRVANYSSSSSKSQRHLTWGLPCGEKGTALTLSTSDSWRSLAQGPESSKPPSEAHRRASWLEAAPRELLCLLW